MTQITWLGHAEQLKFDSGEVLVLDPWIEGRSSGPSERLQNLESGRDRDFTRAFRSHERRLAARQRNSTQRLLQFFESSWLEKKGAKNTIGINKGGTVDLGFVKLDDDARAAQLLD